MGAGGMTTVWRPRVRIEVPDVVVEVESKAEVQEEELLTVKGTKRKRAPPTKGPCEHGVKYRSQCKVCRACPHGRNRYACKECGGSRICEHGRHALSLQGVRWGINLRARSSALYSARSAVGVNMRARSSALSLQGVRWEGKMRARS